MKNSKFDLLVETLYKEFSTIPNFDLTQKDKIGNKLFSIISYRIADITSYKELVVKHYVPATNKAIFNSKNDIRNSKYQHLFNYKDIDFTETLYETIRLSYVGLFHKLENYVNDVISITEILFSETYNSEKSINNWSKEKFDFQIKDWYQFKVVHKINWVSNCVKHRDSYPTKTPKPKEYEFADENERIKISVEEFDKDCSELIQFYPLYLKVMLLFAQHKMVTENPPEKYDDMDEELYNEQLKKLQSLEEYLKFIVIQIKKL